MSDQSQFPDPPSEPAPSWGAPPPPAFPPPPAPAAPPPPAFGEQPPAAPTYGAPTYGAPAPGAPAPGAPGGQSWGSPGYGTPPQDQASGFPPPPQQYQPPPAPYQQYGAAAPGVGPNPFDSRATPILVLGILSIVICGLLGPVAWIMGRNLKSEAETAGWPEPGTAKAGRIIGMVASILMIAVIVFYVVVFVILAAGSATS